MVHNGIEYGIMAAYAEGLNILKNANAGKVQREADAETAPLEQPEYYQYDLDLPEVAEVWRRGSVIGSWLLDLTAAAMQESPDLADFAGRVSDSGEGRWTSIAAIDEGVPAPVLTTALYERFCLARPRRLRRQGALGDAQAVRRPRREDVLGARDGDRARGRRRREGGGAARRRADRRGRRARRSPSAASFALAMSGGRTPWAMLAILGELEEMPWDETELFQVDERIASPGSEDRNLTHMVLGLSMDHQSALRPMPVTQRDLDGAARDYENSLPERLDLVHLGLGPDGHTASLVPGDPVLEVERPPRRPDRDRLPGPPPHDPHLPGDRRRPPDPLAGHRRREARGRWPSCSPATTRSRPAGSRTSKMIVVADEAAAPYAER